MLSRSSTEHIPQSEQAHTLLRSRLVGTLTAKVSTMPAVTERGYYEGSCEARPTVG